MQHLKYSPAALALILLAGCSVHNTENKIQTEQFSGQSFTVNSEHNAQGQDSRAKYLILHYTVTDFEKSLDILTKNNVSAHYLIPDKWQRQNKPIIYRLVPESQRAWHAGVSYWNGDRNLNGLSLGIEIVNRGFDETKTGRYWYAFDPDQIKTVIAVSKELANRHGIKPENVLGHMDIAPGRKSDPGPLFPWEKLAQAGVGAWPDGETVQRYLGYRNRYDKNIDIRKLQSALSLWGYQVEITGNLDKQTQNVISSFQMHFRPKIYDGVPDAETESILKALLEKYQNKILL
ncbi:MAG: N-acetylmuramoyl-L-alanine amidase [Plesiomonas sp.]